jgi:hypothetical protein
MECLNKYRMNIGFCIVLSLLFCLTSLSGYPTSKQTSIDLPPLDLRFQLAPNGRIRPLAGMFISSAISDEKSKSPSENEPKRHLGRAMLEVAAIFAYSQTKYWVTYEEWLEDWQYDLTWHDQSKRFFTLDAWRFDSNCFALNWSHAIAGGLYYNIARTNNLSRLGSLLFTIGSSFYWEYIVEWRNVISISDNIFTILGGVSIGEAWFELGKYLNDKTDLGSRILSFINPVLKLNRWFDRKKTADWPKEPDAGWKRFDFFLGSRLTRSPGQDSYLGYLHGGLHTQLIHIPEFGKPGKINQNISDTLFSEISLDLTTGKMGTEEINLFSRAVFFGHFRQNIDEQHKGYAYYFGLGSGFTYFKKRSTAFYDGCEVKVKRGYDLHLEDPREFTDKFSIVHLAGPMFDLTSMSSRFRLRLVLDAYLDFALVNAYALNTYSIGRDISGIKTNLLYYGYYYGLGTTLSSDINVRIDNLELRGLLRYHAWGSLDGRDRFQVELTDDFHVKDSRLQFRLELGYWIPGTPMEMLSSFEGIQRKGYIKDIAREETEKRFYLGLNFRF